jgi:hypothetical protein
VDYSRTQLDELADLLAELDEQQLEAVALASAAEFEGVVGAYERATGWSAALHNPKSRDAVVVDGQPTRRAALEQLILECHARPSSERERRSA